MNIQDLKQVASYKAKQYKGTAKYLAKNKATVTAVVAGSMLLAPEAMASGTEDLSGLDFSDLSEKAVKYMKEGGKAAFGVLGVGLTVVGGLKGYGMLKYGIKKA